MICLITADVVFTLARAGLSGSAASNEPLFHMPQSDSGSSEGSWSRDGPAADHVAAQVRRPLFMLLGERPVAPRPLRRRHDGSVRAPARPRAMPE